MSTDHSSRATTGAAVYTALAMENHFTRVHNTIGRNEAGVHTKHVGLWVYITGHVQGWQLSEHRVANKLDVGRSFVRSGLASFEQLGLLTRTRARTPDGKLGRSLWFITDLPVVLRELGVPEAVIAERVAAQHAEFLAWANGTTDEAPFPADAQGASKDAAGASQQPSEAPEAAAPAPPPDGATAEVVHNPQTGGDNAVTSDDPPMSGKRTQGGAPMFVLPTLAQPTLANKPLRRTLFKKTRVQEDHPPLPPVEEPAPDARAGLRDGGEGESPSEEQQPPTADAVAVTAPAVQPPQPMPDHERAVAVLESMELEDGRVWHAGADQRTVRAVHVLAAEALAAGHTPGAIRDRLSGGLHNVGSIAAVWRTRLRTLGSEAPRPSDQVSATEKRSQRPELPGCGWCGANAGTPSKVRRVLADPRDATSGEVPCPECVPADSLAS